MGLSKLSETQRKQETLNSILLLQVLIQLLEATERSAGELKRVNPDVNPLCELYLKELVEGRTLGALKACYENQQKILKAEQILYGDVNP